jgi:hypothetical protein
MSAVDAVVAVAAGAQPGGVVVTSDPGDLRALAEHASHGFVVVPV